MVTTETLRMQGPPDQTDYIAYAQNPISGRPALAMWRPASVARPDVDHSRRLSVLILLYPEWLKNAADHTGAPPGSVVSLHDATGKKIMMLSDGQGNHPDQCANPQIANAVEASKSEAGTVIVTGRNGDRRLVAYHRLDGPGGTLRAYTTVSMPLSIILRRNSLNLIYHVFVIVLAGVLMLWTARQMHSSFVSPVQGLVSMADRISGGDLDARYEGPEPTEELARLSSALNHMAGTLQERKARLVYLSEHDITSDVSQIDFGPVIPGVSVGLATMQSPAQTLRDTYQQAEGRMYRNRLTRPDSSRGALIESLRKALSERTHETEEHSCRMTRLAHSLGKRLGVNSSFFDDLELLCALHDIGKVGIPDEVLLKPGPLDEGEWLIMRTHPEIGARIVEGTPELAHIAESILCHHERWDGKGYPRGLAGARVPLISRILAVVDAYDATVSDRPYRKAISPEQAIAEIVRYSGTQFDPMVVSEFVAMIKGQLRLA